MGASQPGWEDPRVMRLLCLLVALAVLAGDLKTSEVQAAAIAEFPPSADSSQGTPTRIAFAADGSLWAIRSRPTFWSETVARLDPLTGRVLSVVGGYPAVPAEVVAGSDGLMYVRSAPKPGSAEPYRGAITAYTATGQVKATVTDPRALTAIAPATAGGVLAGTYEEFVWGESRGDQYIARWLPGSSGLTNVVPLIAPPGGWSIGATRIKTTADGVSWFIEKNFPPDAPTVGLGLAVGDLQIGWVDLTRSTALLLPLQSGAVAEDLTVAGDGSVWVALRRPSGVPGDPGKLTLGRWDAGSRQLTERPMPVPGDVVPRLATGADGAVWMAAGGAAARIDPRSGETSVLALPTAELGIGDAPWAADIVAGPGGTMWVPDGESGALVRIDPDASGADTGLLAQAARRGINAVATCTRPCSVWVTVSTTRRSGANASAVGGVDRRIVLGARSLRVKSGGTVVTRVRLRERVRAWLRSRRRVMTVVQVRTRQRGRTRVRQHRVLMVRHRRAAVAIR
jgi:streptogramin lyase